MTAMNPYAFRGWHLPSYPDGAAAANYAERNYHMYGSIPSGYFTPSSSMYPFNPDGQKQHNGDWKLQSSSVCSTSSDGSPNNIRDQNLAKQSYDGIYKPNTCRNADSTDEHQRSCCALSCSCSSPQQRLPMLNNTWPGADISGALDFNKTSMAMSTMSPYQSLLTQFLSNVLHSIRV